MATDYGSYSWPSSVSSSPSVGPVGSAIPADADLAGAEDPSGNLQALRVDASGYLNVNVQSITPVTGTVTANQGTPGVGAWPVLAAQSSTWSVTATQATGTNLHTVVDSSALPTGASTSALQTTGNTSLSSIDTKTPTLGQALMAASVPVVLASNQSSIPVTVAAGTAIIGKVSIDQTTPGTTNGVQVNAALPAGSNVIGALTANQSVNVAQINGVTPLMGNGVTGTGSQRVTIASDNTAFSVNAAQSGTWTVQPGNSANTTAWLVSQDKAATATLTNVAGSATSVSLLASTAGRKQATFFNDSTAILYLKFGTTASTTSYTVQLAAGGYYELPGVRVYTGAIDGIWASANGAVRITELT